MSELLRILERSPAGASLRGAVNDVTGAAPQMSPEMQAWLMQMRRQTVRDSMDQGTIAELAARGVLSPEAMRTAGVEATAPRQGRRGISERLRELMAQGYSRREAVQMLAQSGAINPRFARMADDVVSPAREILGL